MLQTEPHPETFSIGFYFKAITRILGEPRGFFLDLPLEPGFKKPVGFLLVSSLLFSGASLLQGRLAQPALMAAIFFINALGMTLIASFLGYLVVLVTLGRYRPFNKFFSSDYF